MTLVKLKLQVLAMRSLYYGGGSDYNKVNSLYFVKSDDNRPYLSEISKITRTQQDNVNNPSNVLKLQLMNLIDYSLHGRDTVGNTDKDDILIATSQNDGESFENTTDISNNTDISECPSIVANGDNVYVTLEDLSPGNHEILYRQGYYLSNI